MKHDWFEVKSDIDRKYHQVCRNCACLQSDVGIFSECVRDGATVEKHIPTFSGEPVQLFQGIEPSKLEWVVMAYKYKEFGDCFVSWSKTSSEELAYACTLINNRLRNKIGN